MQRVLCCQAWRVPCFWRTSVFVRFQVDRVSPDLRSLQDRKVAAMLLRSARTKAGSCSDHSIWYVRQWYPGKWREHVEKCKWQEMKGLCRETCVKGAITINELRTVGLIGTDYSPVHRKQPKTGLKCCRNARSQCKDCSNTSIAFNYDYSIYDYSLKNRCPCEFRDRRSS